MTRIKEQIKEQHKLTVELIPIEGGTKLVFTEQGVFFDGYDTPEVREHGTNELLDALGKIL